MIHRTQYANVREMLSMVAVTLSHTEDPINGSYLVPNTVFITSCLLVFLFLIYVFKGEVIFPHFTYKKLRLRVPLVKWEIQNYGSCMSRIKIYFIQCTLIVQTNKLINKIRTLL